jgi:hypothetical protein
MVLPPQGKKEAMAQQWENPSDFLQIFGDSM